MRARGTFKKVSGMEPARRRALSGRRAVSAPRRRSREEDTCAREDDATGVPESREPRETGTGNVDARVATGGRAGFVDARRGRGDGRRAALTSEECAGVRRTRAELRAGQIPRTKRVKSRERCRNNSSLSQSV